MAKDLKIALVISLVVHVFLMSAVVIVNPASRQRMRNYTRVDFLGPLLKKTAFDIMLENANPVVKTSYSQGDAGMGFGRLEAPAPERYTAHYDLSKSRAVDISEYYVLDFLTDNKTVPDFLLESSGRRSDLSEVETDKRRLLYKPEPPFLLRGSYGGKEVFRIKIRVLISADGTVRMAEPVTTSGYPSLDIIAVKYVSSWIFEPLERGSSAGRWEDIQVVLRTGE